MRKTRATRAGVVFWMFLLLPTLAISANHNVKEWTFLIFMNGHNDLDRFGAMDINEMEQVGSTEDLNIVVQWASLAGQNTKRLLVHQDSDTDNVTSPVVQDLGMPVDMGNYESLNEFIDWGVQNYPAKHYFIDVWNHGYGWLPRSRDALQDISFDDLTGHVISTKQLGTISQHAKETIGHPVDILGTDACLMSMLEVTREMSDSVHVFIGSEDLEPGEGWPYDLFLKEWVSTPKASAKTVSKILTKVYVDYYGGLAQTGVTLSSFDLKKINPLLKATQDFGQAILSLDTETKNLLIETIKQTTNFTGWDYIDLLDLLNKISESNTIILDERVTSNLRKTISDFVISNHYSSDFPEIGGVSLWLPNNRMMFDLYKDVYQTLEFDKLTHWSAMLENLLIAQKL